MTSINDLIGKNYVGVERVRSYQLILENPLNANPYAVFNNEAIVVDELGNIISRRTVEPLICRMENPGDEFSLVDLDTLQIIPDQKVSFESLQQILISMYVHFVLSQEQNE